MSEVCTFVITMTVWTYAYLAYSEELHTDTVFLRH